MRLTAAALLLLFGAFGVQAQSPRVDRIEITAKGLYQAGVAAYKDAPGAATGKVGILSNPRNISNTTIIPARLDTNFGMEYRVIGSPNGAAVELTLVTRFPKEGLRDPNSKEPLFRSEYVTTKAIGSATGRTYIFEHAWEIVVGTWTFEIWYQGRKLAEQEFTVVKK